MRWRSGRSYSADLRGRVLAAVDGGGPPRAAASLFSVSPSYVYKALARRRDAGEVEARPQRNRQTPKLAAHHEAIRAEVARHPDATLEELRAWLLAEHQARASVGLMWNTLARLGLTLKKSRGGRRSGTGRTWPRGDRPGAPGRAAWTRGA
jgi:transposase